MSAPNAMLRTTFAVALACAATASTADPAPVEPAAARCSQALEALQAAETSAAAGARGAARQPGDAAAAAPHLLAARRHAALACLGPGAEGPPTARQRAAQPPVAVPPIGALRAPQPAPPLPRPAVPASPGAATRPGTPGAVSSCDVAGCWGSDGSRLDRAGPNLQGPRGLCTVQGTLLQCP